MTKLMDFVKDYEFHRSGEHYIRLIHISSYLNYLSFYLFLSLSENLCIFLFVYLLYLSIYLPSYIHTYIHRYILHTSVVCICLFIHLSAYSPFVNIFPHAEICNISLKTQHQTTLNFITVESQRGRQRSSRFICMPISPSIHPSLLHPNKKKASKNA